MLGGAGLKGRGAMPAMARQRVAGYSRSMSSLRSRPASLSSVRIGGLHRSLNASPSLRSAWVIPGVSAARFNSTSSTPPTSGAAATPTDLPDVPANGTDVADLSALDINSIPEKIGYLKDLGLDFGWGPSAVIEYLIEHIHIWSGLPWWASIVGTGLLIRLALLKPMFGAADTSAKINNVKHITTPLRAEMIKHTRDGNTSAAAKARVDMTELHREHGIKPWKSFVPFLQIPFGIGCFRVVRGMSELPVPGLAAESVAWLQDLTVADPFYILPAVSSIAMYLSMKKGGENGMQEMQNSAFGKIFFYGMPAISFAFMAFFPSALQLYFTATSIFALGQAHLMNSKSFRKAMNIALPNPPTEADRAEQAQKIRMLTELLNKKPEPAASAAAAAEKDTKPFMARLQKEFHSKMDEIRGSAPQTNADGSPAEAPRLSEKDRELANNYEKRRREEEEWKREERNHARRAAHLRTLEQERERARTAWKSAAAASSQGKRQ
ncbi:membrane insertase OXA1 [Aspergillus candidus]|uniref:Inner membrane protein translocase n=1 Tax=Aspergillus candidus TaxID=41067 RepID=A0A2I2FP22_ASPCN|nr:inner membrane protein translocase [Aspergillus candidus]PLB42370.1 inner membrane protein translocase [Aspergillus candidus]